MYSQDSIAHFRILHNTYTCQTFRENILCPPKEAHAAIVAKMIFFIYNTTLQLYFYEQTERNGGYCCGYFAAGWLTGDKS